MILGVNVDHVATLRNARGGVEPDVVKAAEMIVRNTKANGITTHLREDRRHIKDLDVHDIAKIDGIKLNLEMASTAEMQKIALELCPYACCIVPERRLELTTEGGLDVAGNINYMTKFVEPLLKKGINVSLFIDPEEEQVLASYQTGVNFIELHTGSFANAFGTEDEEFEFLRLKKAAQIAQEHGMTVNAGHGLNYENVKRMHEIDGLHELNIGHSIIAKAVFTGLLPAVNEMIDLI